MSHDLSKLILSTLLFILLTYYNKKHYHFIISAHYLLLFFKCWKKFIECEFNFSGFFDENSKGRYLKRAFFCNSMKVYTVTFDQFNASLLNKTIYLFQIKKSDPKTFECYCVHKEVHLNQDRTLQNVKKSRKNNSSSFSDIRALSHGLDIFSNIK